MTLRAKPLTGDESLCVPAGKLQAITALLESRGIQDGEVVAACGIDPGIQNHPDRRIPLRAWVELCRRVSKLLDRPDLGLEIGLSFNGMPTLLGYLLSACETLGEALGKYIRYQRLEHEGWQLVQHLDGTQVELEYRASRTLALDRHVVDFALACLVGQCRLLTGKPLVLREAHFTYAAPADTTRHQRTFQATLHFLSQRNSVVFGVSALAQPLLKANPSVRNLLEQPLQRALAALQMDEPVSVRIAHLLAGALHEGVPELGTVAKALGIGPRRLQMMLKQEETTFRKVRESVRQGLASEYLADPGVTIQEAAFLLGFSEPSAFHRAFRRWTGRTPSDFRRDPITQ